MAHTIKRQHNYMGGTINGPEHVLGTAVHRFARISPSKVKPVIDLIRGREIADALSKLRFSKKRAAVFVEKVVWSAVANLHESNAQGAANDLFVSEAFVNSGPTTKRFQPKDRGKAYTIRKRTSHISVSVKPFGIKGAHHHQGPQSVGAANGGNTINRLTQSQGDDKSGALGSGEPKVRTRSIEKYAKFPKKILDGGRRLAEERPRMALQLADWRITWRNHAGPTWEFSEAASADESVIYPDRRVFEGVHDIRVQIYAPWSRHRACLFLDRFTADSKLFFGVLWAHDAPPEVLWNAGRRFINTVSAGIDSRSHLRWMINRRNRPDFGGGRLESLRKPLTIDEDPDQITGVFLEVDDFEFEAQATRLDPHEMILSVIWPGSPNPSLISCISEIIKFTSARDLKTLGQPQLEQLLEEGLRPLLQKEKKM